MIEKSDARQPRGGHPSWVPQAAVHYLEHTEFGLSLRELAREAGTHASTVMRQVRRLEGRRDDPLVEGALQTMASDAARVLAATGAAGAVPLVDDATLLREGRRILRRLVEPGACLAVAPDMEKAVVVRDMPDGSTARLAVLDRAVAQAMALKDWITCRTPGRVLRYGITASGRAALKRMSLTPEDADAPFASQHRVWAERDVTDEDGERRPLRYNAVESPVQVLARRLERDGRPFLTPPQVAAGERLREDFELAQMGPQVAQNWDRFLTAGARSGYRADSRIGEGPTAARDRVAAALAALGPGLGDVALRCCCFLEGLETAERRMGWSARSGKIVLRIALTQLVRHYEAVGDAGQVIG
ncbi:MAG: helix-turn-helix domain-containing protein [Rhodobacteraceae bacterium]|jgi:hypothetical protein|nr:helix-turn-helix domain-containing protein [Paracoccaceae bacterium]